LTHTVIIGAGWAGLSAAVHHVQHQPLDTQHTLTLLEAAPHVGGRAKSMTWHAHAHSHTIDHGQHLLLGAYQATLDLLQHLQIDTTEVVHRQPLQLSYADGWQLTMPTHKPCSTFIIWLKQQVKWHLYLMLKQSSFTTHERWQLTRLFAGLVLRRWRLRDANLTVTDWLHHANIHTDSTLYQRLFRPLCLAALNTAPKQAAAQVFIKVLRDSVWQTAAHSDFLIPRVPLSDLMAKPATTWLQNNGVQIRTGCPAQQLTWFANTQQWHVHTPRGLFVTDELIVATAPHVAQRLLANAVLNDDRVGYDAAQIHTMTHDMTHDIAAIIAERQHITTLQTTLAALEYEAITTVWLHYDVPQGHTTLLPQGVALMALQDDAKHESLQPAQWVFDHGAIRHKYGLVAVVISAAALDTVQHKSQLLEAVTAQLATTFGWTYALQAHHIITEKRATYACTPAAYQGLSHIATTTQFNYPHHQLRLVGDYTYPDYPATLESAVRSGAMQSSPTEIKPH
jgi:squalene-associated FAD-dependent desaturase